MFAFDDTKEMIEGPSRGIVGYLIAGETIVKLAAGGLHLAAVRSQHTHG
jgi:hypothetical protein